MYKMIGVIFISIICFLVVKAQKNIDVKPRILEERASCEITEAELNNVLIEFNKNALEGSSLIIIGRDAKDEKLTYNLKRISTVVKYFLKQDIRSEKIVLARAKSIDEFGYIEIYINGKLHLVMKTLPKKNFCTYCCEAPDVKVPTKQKVKIKN